MIPTLLANSSSLQGTVLPANSSLVLYCNNNLPGSTNNTGFSLNASGGSLYLFNSFRHCPSLIDG